jgi:SPP1 gp7 family putative phage head morphogenesis protein
MRIYGQLNEFLLPMFAGSENLFLSFSNPVPQDTELDLKTYDSALGKGWMTINEVREEQGLDSVGPDGDVIYLPFSLAPLGSGGPAAAPGATPPPAKAIKAKAAKRGANVKKNRRDIIARSAGGYQLVKRRMARKARVMLLKGKELEKIEKLERTIDQMSLKLGHQLVLDQKKKRNRDVQNKKEVYSKVFLRTADNFEKTFYNLNIKTFKNQRDKIIKRFAKRSARKAVTTDDFLLDEEDESQLLVKVYSPLESQIVKTNGDQAGVLLGLGDEAFDYATRTVQEFLKNRTYKFSFDMTAETNRLLKDNLAEGVKLGESIPQLTKRVREVFDGMSRYRGERIARSEVIRASNFGANEMYKQSGVVDSVEWLVTNDDVTCEFCAPLDGKITPLGETFFDDGDTIRGADGGTLNLDYESIDHPPLHVNCRCTIIPVIK